MLGLGDEYSRRLTFSGARHLGGDSELAQRRLYVGEAWSAGTGSEDQVYCRRGARRDEQAGDGTERRTGAQCHRRRCRQAECPADDPSRRNDQVG